ncbi:hypothetical protein [Eikenella halliae]|nr:hypothetical protein [Eikenella halliae]
MAVFSLNQANRRAKGLLQSACLNTQRLPENKLSAPNFQVALIHIQAT